MHKRPVVIATETWSTRMYDNAPAKQMRASSGHTFDKELSAAFFTATAGEEEKSERGEGKDLESRPPILS